MVANVNGANINKFGTGELELFFQGLINLLDPQFNCANIKKFGGLQNLGLLIF